VFNATQRPKDCPTEFCFGFKYSPHKRTYYCCADSKEAMFMWVSTIQKFIQQESPKNSKEWAKKHAKAIDHPPSSFGNQSETIDDEIETSEDSDDVFKTHKMRLSRSPWS